jgi:hypothetical protein
MADGKRPAGPKAGGLRTLPGGGSGLAVSQRSESGAWADIVGEMEAIYVFRHLREGAPEYREIRAGDQESATPLRNTSRPTP